MDARVVVCDAWRIICPGGSSPVRMPPSPVGVLDRIDDEERETKARHASDSKTSERK
jgi:hypothetical protein